MIPAVTHFEYIEAPGVRAVWRLHYHNRVEHLDGIKFEKFRGLHVRKAFAKKRFNKIIIKSAPT